MTSQLLMLKVKTGLKTIPTVFADSTTAENAHIRQFMKRTRGALIVTGFSPHTTSAEDFERRLFSDPVELIFMQTEYRPVEGCLETVLHLL